MELYLYYFISFVTFIHLLTNQDENISKTSNECWIEDSHVIIISDDEVVRFT